MSLISIKIEKLVIQTEECKPTEKVTGYISNLSVFENAKLLFTIKGKLNIMAIQLKDNQKATYQLKFVDAKGADTDAASVDVALDPNVGGSSISYDDPTNTVTVMAGLPGVSTIKITPKDSAGTVLAFPDEALEVTAGDAVSGSHSEPVIEQQ